MNQVLFIRLLKKHRVISVGIRDPNKKLSRVIVLEVAIADNNFFVVPVFGKNCIVNENCRV